MRQTMLCNVFNQVRNFVNGKKEDKDDRQTRMKLRSEIASNNANALQRNQIQSQAPAGPSKNLDEEQEEKKK